MIVRKSLTSAYFLPAKIQSAAAGERTKTKGHGCDAVVSAGAASEITKDHLSSRLSSHLVTKLNRTALVGFDLRQMESDVSVQLLEELDPITNQDRQDRIANFVG